MELSHKTLQCCEVHGVRYERVCLPACGSRASFLFTSDLAVLAGGLCRLRCVSK